MQITFLHIIFSSITHSLKEHMVYLGTHDEFYADKLEARSSLFLGVHYFKTNGHKSWLFSSDFGQCTYGCVTLDPISGNFNVPFI